jgi:hypothetical protein
MSLIVNGDCFASSQVTFSEHIGDGHTMTRNFTCLGYNASVTFLCSKLEDTGGNCPWVADCTASFDGLKEFNSSSCQPFDYSWDRGLDCMIPNATFSVQLQRNYVGCEACHAQKYAALEVAGSSS